MSRPLQKKHRIEKKTFHNFFEKNIMIYAFDCNWQQQDGMPWLFQNLNFKKKKKETLGKVFFFLLFIMKHSLCGWIRKNVFAVKKKLFVFLNDLGIIQSERGDWLMLNRILFFKGFFEKQN